MNGEALATEIKVAAGIARELDHSISSATSRMELAERGLSSLRLELNDGRVPPNLGTKLEFASQAVHHARLSSASAGYLTDDFNKFFAYEVNELSLARLPEIAEAALKATAPILAD